MKRRAWNSSLPAPEKPIARRTPLRRRTLKEINQRDPERYGELFEAVRREPCFGIKYLPGHKCGLGYCPASAHHLHRKDREGMVPARGKLHDLCELYPSEVDARLAEAGSPSLEELGQMYVLGAMN